jgi:geranylgeranyl pyrophosphate synthase
VQSKVASFEFVRTSLIIDDSMVELSQFFSDVSDAVDAKLEEILELDRPSIAKRLDDAIRWSIFGGGKRFRPALVFASGRAYGAADEPLAGTATAIEMLHTYSLIHDDLPSMDDDDLRRGRETCHKRFGEATAILAGDALQAMAFEVIAGDVTLSAETRLQLIKELSEAAGKMVTGQQLDLDAEGGSVTPGDVSEIHANKTGALITFSARAGAIIARVDENRMTGVTHYGARLGLLFQIADDILDVTQPTDVLGKTAAKDLVANKATYPSVYGLDGSNELRQRVYENTIESLELFDVPTAMLAQIAEYVATRQS